MLRPDVDTPYAGDSHGHPVEYRWTISLARLYLFEDEKKEQTGRQRAGKDARKLRPAIRKWDFLPPQWGCRARAGARFLSVF